MVVQLLFQISTSVKVACRSAVNTLTALILLDRLSAHASTAFKAMEKTALVSLPAVCIGRKSKY